MKVRDSDGHAFTIACSVDSRWSKCGPLSVGESYEARRGKHGITVWVPNSNGKEATRLYRLAGEDATTPAQAPAAETQPNGESSSAQPRPEPPPQPVAVAPGQKASDATPLAAPPPPSRPAQKAVAGNVMCDFSSMPSGAEITLDGKICRQHAVRNSAEPRHAFGGLVLARLCAVDAGPHRGSGIRFVGERDIAEAIAAGNRQ